MTIPESPDMQTQPLELPTPAEVLAKIKANLPKVEELIADLAVCTGETSRALLTSAARKYSVCFAEFKI